MGVDSSVNDYGTTVVLVDECTSGVDPLSRRSIWRTLTAVKTERTIVFTTHVSQTYSYSFIWLLTLSY